LRHVGGWKTLGEQIMRGLTFSVLVATIAVMACSGCQKTPADSVDPVDAGNEAEWERQTEQYQRQLDKADEQIERTERQIERAEKLYDRCEKQAQRLDKIHDRWEDQADRYDKILDKWEKQSPLQAIDESPSDHDKITPPDQAAATRRITPEVENEIRSLIESLASTNSPPPAGDGIFGLDRPRDWDYDAQRNVRNARLRLSQMGKLAFPILLENQHDERFSMIQSTSVEYPVLVGEVCRQIIRSNVTIGTAGYKSRKGADGEGHNCPYFFDANYRDDLDGWWNDNRDKTLKQMRIDTLKWRIQQEKTIGFPDEKSRRNIMDRLVAKLAEIESH